MNTVPLSYLFNIKYGNSFDLTVLEVCDEDYKDKVNYVSRTRENNGVSAIVKRVTDITPFKAGLITVAASGNSVMESCVQLAPFYTGFHVFVLVPQKPMDDLEKIFYCHCIRQNRYRYNFGRQANKTLKNILVPSEMPKAFQNIILNNVTHISKDKLINNRLDLNISKWKYFKLSDLFKITGSKTTPLIELEEYGEGKYPYVTTQATDNGVAGFYNYFTESGNILTIDSAVLGYCSYQPLAFSASDHVEKLIPKFEINKYIAIFLTTVLNLERFRYNYGRKASQGRLRRLSIKLPSKNDKPDYKFMEEYIKTLPCSNSL